MHVVTGDHIEVHYGLMPKAMVRTLVWAATGDNVLVYDP